MVIIACKHWFKFVCAYIPYGEHYLVTEILLECSEQLGEATETGDVYVQAFRLTTPSLPAGTYRINWSFEFKGSSSNREVGVRIQLNDSAAVADLFINELVFDSSYKQFGSFTQQVLTAAVHTLDFDIRRVAAQPVTALIQNIRADIWRVA